MQKNAPTADQETLTSFAIESAKEVQEQAKKLALDLKAKREKRKRDWDENSNNTEPAQTKAKASIPEELITAVLSEFQVTDDVITETLTSHLKINNTEHEHKDPPPPPAVKATEAEGEAEEGEIVEGVEGDQIPTSPKNI